MSKEPRLEPDNNIRPEGPRVQGEVAQEPCTSDLLDIRELSTLKGMVLYWREVAKRDEQIKLHILAGELGQVIHLLGAEKVLLIIAEYVEGRS